MLDSCMNAIRKLLPVIIIVAVIGTLCAWGYVFDQVLTNKVYDSKSDELDLAMKKLTEVWNNKNFLRASLPIVLQGDEESFQWLELTTKALLVSEALVSGLKYTLNRARPTGPESRKNSSFPSSHASSAFAFAWCVSKHYPELREQAHLLAVSICVSRVYLNRHYPTDVIAGACIGVLAGYLTEVYFSWFSINREWLLKQTPLKDRLQDPAIEKHTYFRSS